MNQDILFFAYELVVKTSEVVEEQSEVTVGQLLVHGNTLKCKNLRSLIREKIVGLFYSVRLCIIIEEGVDIHANLIASFLHNLHLFISAVDQLLNTYCDGSGIIMQHVEVGDSASDFPDILFTEQVSFELHIIHGLLKFRTKLFLEHDQNIDQSTFKLSTGNSVLKKSYESQAFNSLNFDYSRLFINNYLGSFIEAAIFFVGCVIYLLRLLWLCDITLCLIRLLAGRQIACDYAGRPQQR